MTDKNILSVFLLFFGFIFINGFSVSVSSAEKWDNPANRYLDEHKKYQNVTCPVPQDSIRHFVYFARDRDAIKNHPFLKHERFDGAQIMFAWSHLEKKRGEYDFSKIASDVQYLAKHNKKLFIQLQDASFSSSFKPVPKYLEADEFAGGVVAQYFENGKQDGWVAKRWNAEVRKRFAALLNALGQEFDGQIAGINLQETAIGVSSKSSVDFEPAIYRNAIKANMLALKKAFPESTTIQYANFMPGEWLPWEDEGYLKSVYQYGNEIGVGLGAPDLMFKRKGQLNHALAMMHEQKYQVPLAIAIQDGNYIGETGEARVVKNSINIVPQLHAFAADFLNINIMFWVNQQPYFQEHVMPCFSSP